MARRFWWLRWLLTRSEMVFLIRDHNRRERERHERLLREAKLGRVGVRFCRRCGECVGGLRAVLALKRCPACRASIVPVEEHTER